MQRLLAPFRGSIVVAMVSSFLLLLFLLSGYPQAVARDFGFGLVFSVMPGTVYTEPVSWLMTWLTLYVIFRALTLLSVELVTAAKEFLTHQPIERITALTRNLLNDLQPDGVKR